VTSSSPPSSPASDGARAIPPVDTSPAGLWIESDKGGRIDATASFPSRPANPANEHAATIGHIGRYALKRQLCAGGLGAVYAAHDPLLSRLIAVKTLHLDVPEEQRAAFNALFLNEARAAAGLSHPQIVTVFDAGISDERAYIAMELLKGRDLRQLREEGWRPTPAQAAVIVRRVADALAYAHSKGVVHRDVKPANIFMVGRTQPRVLDFGIARVAHQRDNAGSELAAASPYYMAPEQARHQPVDRRADVFSLGVVLYELLTDTKPFRGTSLSEITDAVLNHTPPRADTVDASVPAGLAAIAERAMEKDPNRRYRSARTFAQALREWLDDNAGPAEGEPAAPRRRTGIRVGALAAAAVLLGAIAWFFVSKGIDASLPFAATAQPSATELSATPPAPSADRAAAATTDTPITTTPGDARPSSTVVVEPTQAPSLSASAVASSSTLAPAPNAPAPATLDSATLLGAPATAPSTVAPPTAVTVAPPTTQATAAPAADPAAPAAAPTLRSAARSAVPKAVIAKESAGERKQREAREREARASTAPVAVPAPTGLVRIAISPWGRVEVDGADAGLAPPLRQLTLPEGTHRIVVRNEDFPPYNASVTVTPGQPVTLKYRFGS